MKRLFSGAILLATVLSMAPGGTLLAQPVQDGTAGGGGARLATPTYPAGTDTNPALDPKLRRTMTNVPAAENPKVPGATGKVVIPGNNSTIVSDRGGTIEQKTGAASTGQSGNGGGQ